ncbi:MAG: LuxR family transcriptional regulator [Desulfobacterales bacterium SG8_35]|nr:MAG: LuxR family transcriptional regulator [Desulfobacterales bacterium SG8_35]
MPEIIKLLICDDHAIVRMGLRSLIAGNSDMKLLGEATDGEEAVVLARELKPDVIIMDLLMPRKDGVAAISEIKKKNPEARILVLTGFSDDKNVFSALKAGANGYLLKDSAPGEVVQAIREVYQGKSSLHPVIARKVIQEIHHPSDLAPTDDLLSEREIEVLKYVAMGMSNQEIARTLEIKEGTVRIHVGNILNKLQLANRTQAALYALRKGIARL